MAGEFIQDTYKTISCEDETIFLFFAKKKGRKIFKISNKINNKIYFKIECKNVE